MNDEQFGNLVIKVGERIKRHECSLDDDEKDTLIGLLFHRKMYIAQICTHLGISQRTLETRVANGELPPFRKEPSGKKYMYLDELEQKR